jgi:hypothetical protein
VPGMNISLRYVLCWAKLVRLIRIKSKVVAFLIG